MSAPKLRAVDATLPDPPYPADIKANGFCPQVDWQRMKSSTTWRLCPSDMRNHLFRMWMESWNEVPAGSWENDVDLIAAVTDIPRRFFDLHGDIFLRGWVLHSDGRLYHRVIAEMVESKMLVKRRGGAERQRRYRERLLDGSQKIDAETAKNDAPVTDNGNVSNALLTHQSRVSNTIGDIDIDIDVDVDKKTKEDSRSLAIDPPPPPPKKAEKPKKPRTPYQAILDLYREMLPMCEQPLGVDHWTETRKSVIRARWQKQMPDLDAWRECFGYVAASRFLTGRAKTSDGRKPFRASLFWIAKEENLLKIYEGKYDD